jgi:hypothetical protein
VSYGHRQLFELPPIDVNKNVYCLGFLNEELAVCMQTAILRLNEGLTHCNRLMSIITNYSVVAVMCTARSVSSDFGGAAAASRGEKMA